MSKTLSWNSICTPMVYSLTIKQCKNYDACKEIQSYAKYAWRPVY